MRCLAHFHRRKWPCTAKSSNPWTLRMLLCDYWVLYLLGSDGRLVLRLVDVLLPNAFGHRSTSDMLLDRQVDRSYCSIIELAHMLTSYGDRKWIDASFRAADLLGYERYEYSRYAFNQKKPLMHAECRLGLEYSQRHNRWTETNLPTR